jgi:hypothetical protein
MFAHQKVGQLVSDVNFVHIVKFGKQYLICKGIYALYVGSCTVGEKYGVVSFTIPLTLSGLSMF